MYISLEQIKRHLNIDEDYIDDDIYLTDLIDVSEDAVKQHLNIASLDDIAVGGGLPPSVIHSIILMAGNLYANREPVSYTNTYTVPYSYEYLLSSYKQY